MKNTSYRNSKIAGHRLLKSITGLMLLFCGLTALVHAGGHDQLGVQTHYGHRGWEPVTTLPAIKKLGVGWIRDDLFWSTVEKEKGKYEIPAYAWKWLKGAKANGLKVILILNGRNPKNYKDPFDHDGFVKFAAFVAKEVRGYADAIELINEPFNTYRWSVPGYNKQNSHWNGWNAKTGKIDYWVKKYLKTMNAAAEAIHKVAPGEYKIIGLGCSPPLNVRLLRMGVSPHVDGMVIHPYSYKCIPELQPYGNTPGYLKRDGIVVGDKQGTFTSINDQLMAESRKHNGPSELWITELGFTTYKPITPENYAGFTESAQAKYAQRQLLECLGTNVRLVSWYNFYEKGNRPHHKEDHFGLMRRDGTLKPAYYAIQRVAQTMLSWHADKWGKVKVYFKADRPDQWPIVWDGSKIATTGAVRAYTFANEAKKQRAVTLWSTERANGDLQPRIANVTISSNRIVTRIKAMDMMTGKETSIPFQQSGQLVSIKNLTIPDHPVMLILSGTKTATSTSMNTPDLLAPGRKWQLYESRKVKASWKKVNNTGTLQYQFPTTGKGFTGIRTTLSISKKTPCITFQVKTSEKATALVRVYDKTGQTHQYKICLAGSGQWESHAVTLTSKPQVSFGGAKDKRMHFPMSGIFFGVEASHGPRNGTLQLRDIQLEGI